MHTLSFPIARFRINLCPNIIIRLVKDCKEKTNLLTSMGELDWMDKWVSPSVCSRSTFKLRRVSLNLKAACNKYRDPSEKSTKSETILKYND